MLRSVVMTRLSGPASAPRWKNLNMIEMIRRLLIVTASMAPACSQFPAIAVAEEAEEPRFAVAAKLESALKAAETAADPETQTAVLRSAADEARRMITANVFVQDLFHRVQQSKVDDPGRLAKEWRNAVTEARDLLRFEPLLEAPLPEGFPKPAPVGEIRVQPYPSYRVARTDMTLVEGRAFWTLFNHIKQREIAMTAPVEMGYAPGKDGAITKTSMSFLYRNTKQGQLEVDGKVTVVDVPAQQAVSIGFRGDATKERVNDAKRRLEDWLQAHRDEYEPAGAMRVMGYNSPFVADQKKLTEVPTPFRSE